MTGAQPILDVRGSGHHLSAQIGRHARQFGDHVAISFEGNTTTYAQLDERVGQLAAGLAAAGIVAGDRVGVLMSNRPEFVESMAAICRIDAIAVPLNFRLSTEELRFQLADSGARLLITDSALKPSGVAASADTSVSTVVAVGDNYEEYFSHGSAPDVSIDESATAVILYTSGTTGRPKGAMLSHRSLQAYVTSRYAHLGMPARCRNIMGGTPLFHIAGIATLLGTIFVAGRLVLLPSGGFDPELIIKTLDEEQVNVAFFVPSQWQEIVRHPATSHREFPHLISASWGAAPATKQLIAEIHEAFPAVELWTAFGQTEICGSGTLLLATDAAERPASVGKAMIHVEHRIVDTDMNDVAPGDVGEIVYRGPTVMLGYWNRPDATAEAFSGGWFHSGDLVRQDEDGFLYVVDRIKDMIISGGENIYCAEVENVISSHPKVDSVAVIGVPHDTWGEVPLAVIVPRGPQAPDAAEIEAYARQSLASYKVPRQVLVLDQMPTNASGKIVKQRLRDLVKPTA